MYNFKVTYKRFPAWQDSCDGMEVIRGDLKNIHVASPPDVVYAVKDGYKLHLRFFFPEDIDEKKYPCILHVKGSGWGEQNLNNRQMDLYPLIKAGYGLCIIQYRPADIAKFPAQILDAKTAIRYLTEHIEEYPIDPNNLFLSGDSSGGHTAILDFLTWNEELFETEGEDTPLPPLRGLIDFYGVTNLYDLTHRETGLSQEDNYKLTEYVFEKPIEEYPEQYSEANVLCYIDLRETLEPVLILHGNKDRLVPLSQSIAFYEALKERNARAELVMIEDADHGGPVFYCEATIHCILKFLKENTR